MKKIAIIIIMIVALAGTGLGEEKKTEQVGGVKLYTFNLTIQNNTGGPIFCSLITGIFGGRTQGESWFEENHLTNLNFTLQPHGQGQWSRDCQIIARANSHLCFWTKNIILENFYGAGRTDNLNYTVGMDLLDVNDTERYFNIFQNGLIMYGGFHPTANPTVYNGIFTIANQRH